MTKSAQYVCRHCGAIVESGQVRGYASTLSMLDCCDYQDALGICDECEQEIKDEQADID